jgi:tRNA/rRNA methyltransferase
MRNFGLDDLRLVNPTADLTSPEARRMAMRACGTLERAQIFGSLSQALGGVHTVVATTARQRCSAARLFSPEEFFEAELPRLLGSPTPQLDQGTAFVFGNEESGLSNDDLLVANAAITFETSPQMPSLNLSQAVGLVCYEISNCRRRASDAEASLANRTLNKSKSKSNNEKLLSAQELNMVVAHAEKLLSELNFVQPHTSRSRMARLRSILRRSRMSIEDAKFIDALIHFVRHKAVD